MVVDVPIEVSVDKQAGVIRRKYSGAVSGEEILASFAEVIGHPDYQPGVKSLMDFREYRHQLSSQDLRDVADFFIEHGETVKGAKAAVVVSQTVSYGLVRMLQAYLETFPVQLEVFFDMEEGERWLGV